MCVTVIRFKSFLSYEPMIFLKPYNRFFLMLMGINTSLNYQYNLGYFTTLQK